DVPLKECIAALCSLKARGLTRAIGVSNFPPALLREAIALASEPLAVNQVEYHPYLDQSALLAALREAGMGLTAYCPLARGQVLTEPVIGDIATRHGVSAATVAVAWLIAQDSVIAIPRSRSPERLAENLKAETLVLSAEETAAISALAHPGGRLVSPAFAPDWAAA
ncbi:MAG: aldo/keto reductase, partial [Pseudomonadota bacterium]